MNHIRFIGLKNFPDRLSASRMTDDELSHIFQAAMPITLDRRDAFLEQVAGLLRGCTGPIGPGTVYRAIEQAQRLYFDPPENGRTPSWARWDRDEPKFERVSKQAAR
jgi:hypothetical protein